MDQQQLFIKMVLQGWEIYIRRTEELFNGLSDEQLLKEVSPGRNRGVYLLGHLTAVHDRMLPLLGLGKANYPQLDSPFLSNPDKSSHEFPPISELRQQWADINKKLADGFSTLSPENWFERHTAVTQEDFAKEPHRNKLNLIINRTGHLASHYGQLIFLKY
ncbi:DinB family protein [Flavitalea flava]